MTASPASLDESATPSEPRVVLQRQTRDADGRRNRWVTLHDDGGLSIGGHDLGPGVERFFGVREYEFSRKLSPGDTEALVSLLGGHHGDLGQVLEQRFDSTVELEHFLRGHGINGEFWSRAGE